MEKRDYELKNTAPVEMTDKGPRGTTRYKSKDGRYTAGVTVEVEDQYTDSERRKIRNRFDTDTGNFDKLISDKLFANVWRMLVFPMFNKNLLPGEEVFFIKSNDYNDLELGIDYQFGVRGRDENGNRTFRKVVDLDLKTVTSVMGNKESYKNNSVFISLYYTKKDDKSNEWVPGPFNNEEHQNTHFGFLIPDCNESAESVTEKIRQNPDYVPVIPHAKLIIARSEKLQQYVGNRITNNEDVQNLINTFKSNDAEAIDKFFTDKENPLHEYIHPTRAPGCYDLKIPVPGENFLATIIFKTRKKDGGRNITLKLPNEPFKDGRISCAYGEL